MLVPCLFASGAVCGYAYACTTLAISIACGSVYAYAYAYSMLVLASVSVCGHVYAYAYAYAMLASANVYGGPTRLCLCGYAAMRLCGYAPMPMPVPVPIQLHCLGFAPRIL